MDTKSRTFVMAKLYLKNRDFNMAERSFNEYLSMNPEDVTALKLLAQVHEQTRRYDKAFEMYERCYLTEPNRTGVLLDICRILLMDGVTLDNVDYRKWFNLAIQAFPSNPMVVTWKSFLSTLPAEDQTRPEQENLSRNHRSEEDAIVKILNKLSLMEKRLERIEDKINKSGAGLSFTAVSAPPPATTPAPASFTASIPSLASLTLSPQPPKPLPNSAPQPAPAPTKASAPTPTSALPPARAPTPAPVPTPATVSTPARAPTPAPAPAPAPTPAPAPLSTSIMAPVTASALPFGQSPAPISFNFSSKLGEGGGNLFAASMQKLNLPSDGWSSSFNFTPKKDDEPKEEEDKDDDEGGVPNEELAIENTCDMEPIEIKTGEEDEDVVFENRCKLFRLREKEYKERGLGSIKVLKHKSTGKGRLIMRREAIGLVCLNCWDLTKIERVRDTQVRWMGIDASDGEPEGSIFLVKFKTNELTDTFMSHLTELFPNEPSSTNTSFSASQPKTATSNNNETPAKLNATSPKVETPDTKLNPLENKLGAFGGSLFGSALAPAPVPAAPSASPFSFNFSSNSVEGGNLFAASMKKLNLPSEGWSSSGFNFTPKMDNEENNKEEEDKDDDGGVVPNEELAIENTCDMQPIEIKTGEEDEDVVFENRCKLFRLRDKEYKERGLGSIKVLKHKSTGKGRLIMRREAIGLVCLNCWDLTKIERVRDTQVRWMGIDASDGEPEGSIFLVKFKTNELTDTFMSHLTELFPNETSSTNTSFSAPQPNKSHNNENTTNKSNANQPDIELIDPKLDQSLVDKARKLQLPDLFYHKLKNQDPCGGCNGCEDDD